MKRDDKILLLTSILLFSLALSFNYNIVSIIGNSFIDIFATFSTASLSITIDNSPPLVVIDHPTNGTTYNYGNIYLYYNVSDQFSNISNILYSLNNEQNITLAINSTNSFSYYTILNASHGQNNVTLYANDTLGFLNSSQVSFTVNISMSNNFFMPSYFNMSGALTTDLNSLNKSEMERLENFTIHNINFGMIDFEEVINLSDDGKDHTQNAIFINLSALINITANKVFVDSVSFRALNKSAIIRLVNLTFQNPIIARDGQLCPETICVTRSYSGGTLEFKVSYFSEYEAQEGGGSGGGGVSGGGGGGGSSKESPRIDLDAIDNYIVYMRFNDKIFILFKGNLYSIRINKVTKDDMLVRISPLGVNLNMRVGFIAGLDLDGDNKKDIEIMLKSKSTGNLGEFLIHKIKPKFEFPISLPEPKDIVKEEPREIRTEKPMTREMNYTMLYIILILILAYILFKHYGKGFMKIKRIFNRRK